MESCYDTIHARHPVLIQVQEESDVPEAHDSGACERIGVLRR